MAYSFIKSGIKSTVLQSVPESTIGPTQGGSEYGRVLDIVLDSSHPKWKELGESQALYGVFYQTLFRGNSTKLAPEYNFAYCLHANVRQIPVKNEIVLLTSTVGVDSTLNMSVKMSEVQKTYWTDVISAWNHPNLNAYSDQIASGSSEVDTGKYFKESSRVNPLQLFPGDYSIEGRHGQTIRFGGTSYKTGSFSTDANNGCPYIIIRDGQGSFADSPDLPVIENINQDSSSVYIMSKHKVPLIESSQKRNAWKDNSYVWASKYEGSQIVANSDRIVINARNKDVELIAKEATGISSKTVNIDGKDYIATDASKIYLGNGAFQENEPVLKGQTSVDWLSDLCNQLTSLLDALSKPQGDSKVWISTVIGIAAGTKASLKSLQNQLPGLRSKKSFVE